MHPSLFHLDLKINTIDILILNKALVYFIGILNLLLRIRPYIEKQIRVQPYRFTSENLGIVNYTNFIFVWLSLIKKGWHDFKENQNTIFRVGQGTRCCSQRMLFLIFVVWRPMCSSCWHQNISGVPLSVKIYSIHTAI